MKNSFENKNLNSLMSEAKEIRDANWGKEITYSRKVFIPLTNMCRDTCGYCTFVKHPDTPEANILTPDQVIKIVKSGERKGCKEALLSLGEKPELRYEKAKDMLMILGYDNMIDYLSEICSLILKNSSLLPHVNPGTMSENDIKKLKPVSASMGMMLETISKRLNQKNGPHYACPDKVPIQRIRTLERAGKYNVPFTTGLLIGIGETWEERLEALYLINEIHQKYGNIQEVIIQNFQPKPDIKMSNHKTLNIEEILRTISVARIILSPEISLQAPPNLHSEHLSYLDAGINDWGGISPLTIDFINPEMEWPEINFLSKKMSVKGYILKERLTVYPKYVDEKKNFISSEIRTQISKMETRIAC